MRRLINLIFNYFLWKKGIEIGENSIVKRGSFFQKDKLKIGSNVYLGPDSYIHAGGGVFIDNGTVIGPKVKIWSVNHDYNNFDMLPYNRNVIKSKVFIGKGCWIGLDVRICPNIKIGNGVVIAMGSVITKDIPDFCVVGGNPAKVIKKRYTNDEEKNLLNKLINEENFYGRYFFEK